MFEFFHLFNLLRSLSAIGALLFIAGFWFGQLLLLMIGSVTIALAIIVSKCFERQADEAMRETEEYHLKHY